MTPRCLWAGFLLLLAACGARKEPAADIGAPQSAEVAELAPPPTATPSAPPKNAALATASQLLETGKYDEAAARLLEVRSSGQELSQAEAADFRAALEEAYSRAVEEAAKGNPRGRATLQMIKAATAR
jgi:hypothetical protein